jgi:hypothetical protein
VEGSNLDLSIFVDKLRIMGVLPEIRTRYLPHTSPKFYCLGKIDILYHYNPTDGVSTLLCWWGLSAPETLSCYAGGSVSTGRVTHAGQFKG